jgi:AcrR family transcriptional regulator
MDDADTRDRILETTYEMLSQTPYPRLTVEAVAARAGVSKALLFYHFGTKRELARSALISGFKRELERFDIPDSLEENEIMEALPEMMRLSRDRFNLIGAFIEVSDMDDPEDELAMGLRSLYRMLMDALVPVLEGRGVSYPRERALLAIMAVDLFGMVPHLDSQEPDVDRYMGALVAMMGLSPQGGGDATGRGRP